jgi:hypothetical protein
VGETLRLRTPGPVCKPSRVVGRAARVALLLAVLTALTACVSSPITRTVSLAALESAAPVPVSGSERFIVSDPASLRQLCHPLGPRLALVEVRNAAEWRQLRTAVPEVGPAPSFRDGCIFGLACQAGTPLDGHWPLSLETVQAQAGGGLLRARYAGGTFLPDGTTRLELDYAPGIQSILVVEINGTSFYPDRINENTQ